MHKVSEAQEGIRLLAFLREKYPDFASVKALKRAIEAGLARVNGKTCAFSSFVLAAGDVVSFEPKQLPPASKRPPKILYEDPWLLICDKPPNIVCDASTFQALFPSYLLVHRLDKETSGVLLLAKTEAVKKLLVALFAKREIQKEYLALVDGIVAEKEGKIDNFLGKKISYQGQSLWGKVKEAEGQRAISRWKCLKKGKEASLLLCMPETGRTHQLRAHLSEMGHPILGDRQYGKKWRCSLTPTRHLLHAWQLSFLHPITHKQLSVTAPLPDDLQSALENVNMAHAVELLHKEKEHERGHKRQNHKDAEEL